MAKIIVDCGELEDLESIETEIDEILTRVKSCNVTYFRQAQARMEAENISQREAARQIAGETGETPKAVEHKIIRGKQEEMPQRGAQPGRPTKSQVKREKNRKSQAPIKEKVLPSESHLGDVKNYSNSACGMLRVDAEVCLGEKVLHDCLEVSVRLKGSAKNFSRSKYSPPDNMTEEQKAAWEKYFIYAEIVCLAQKLQQHYHNQLPNELPKHKAKRGRPKKENNDLVLY